ncbi:unnamed protein product [Didymodactylos carnosus]|uniref:B box-type domain-containing protein n=1 Tax=Didymodactylos carnosus TaxID=1234261 RepID=A0A814T7K1_9BILA|nr:unnamed protein product [Didymodactylos carnosus]CAF1157046.1 unnamed protein product [Didymodactylos carnosus]CAF3750091.1 unnamed protein product [Didymodactylos carnosus]CAF3920469.1 unnamed protein product [Didymodactylos carnosus]
MSQQCEIESCKKQSSALCHHCKKNVCLKHLNEHAETINKELYPLADQVNNLLDKLSQLTPEYVKEQSSEQLEKWRRDCYRLIDQLYEEKLQEIEKIVQQNFAKSKNEQLKVIRNLQNEIGELIRDKDATYNQIEQMTDTMKDAERNLVDLQSKFMRIQAQPLNISKDSVRILSNMVSGISFDISKLGIPIKTINFQGTWYTPIATNNKYIVVQHQSDLCLYDLQLNLVNKMQWKYGQVTDICYQSMINAFFILTKDSLYTFDTIKMDIKNTVITVKTYHDFCCISCNDAALYLCYRKYGTPIEVYDTRSVKLLEQWSPPQSCAKDEWLDKMQCTNVNLCLIIYNKTRQDYRLELRHLTVMNLLWTLNLTIKSTAYQCGLCVLPRNEWLLLDPNGSNLLQVTSDGKLKETVRLEDKPYYAILIGNNCAVMSNKSGITLHNY